VTLRRRLVLLLVALLSALGGATLVRRGPELYYRLATPQAADECTSIRPGMSLSEVKTLVRKRVPPREEMQVPGQYRFRRNGVCRVTLNAAGRVTQAHFSSETEK